MSKRDPKLSSTARPGFEPKIEQPVGEVELDIGDVLIPPGKLGKVSDDDTQAINDFYAGTDSILGFEDAQNELDEFDRILDEKLADLRLEYDPDEYPQLHAGHQHLCGRPGSTNVITYDDLKNRWALEKAQFKRHIGAPTNLDDMDQSGGSLQSQQEKLTADSIGQMLALVVRQILIWVLEFFLKMFSPLKKIKFVKKIPKAIERAIARLRGGASVFSGPDAIINTFGDDTDPTTTGTGDIDSADLAKAGGGYTGTIKEVVETLPPECLAHTANWLQAVDRLIADKPEFAAAYYAKKINGKAQDRMTSLNKLAALGIPNGHLITRKNGSTLSYSNPLPEEYLQARADGSTKFQALNKGLVTSIKSVGNTFIPRMRRLISNLVSDPSLLCCLIRNISVIANTQKLRRILLLMQALLQVWRNILNIDLNKELARLGNLVVDLLNNVLQSILSAFTTFFYNKLSSWVFKKKDLDELKRMSSECKPWVDMINLAIEILEEMIRRVSEYLTSFFANFNLEIDRLSRSADKAAQLAYIDKLLNLINKILQFAAAWAFCIENTQDPRVILGQANRLRVGDTGITLAPKPATIPKNGIKAVTPGTDSRSEDVFSKTTGSSTQGDGRGLASDGPFSTDGLQILLTNYLGVDNKKANAVTKSIQDNDCACDKSLTPDELTILENLIKERK